MLQRREAMAFLALAGMLLAAAPVSVQAQEAAARPAEAQPNVSVTIRVHRLDHGQRRLLKSYNLLVAPDTPGSKLLSGSRVPLPMGGDGSDKAAFIYQNIGFSANAEVKLLGDGRIKLVALIEDSRLAETVAGRPPVVETRQLSVNAVLTDGKPMEVTRVESETDPSGLVEVEAKILK